METQGLARVGSGPRRVSAGRRAIRAVAPALVGSGLGARFRLTALTHGGPGVAGGSGLAADLVAGFARVPKRLPPKHFYDERGARLFDAICRTPEYYLTRAEQALLSRVARAIVAEARPTHLVELGSGAAKKTRVILDAIAARTDAPTYVPVDISAEMLIRSAAALLVDYPTLRVHGLVADYEHHLHLLPDGPRRLIAFLGSTLGNFDQPAAVAFASAIAAGMRAEDRLLIGVDLVKSPRVLHAAYNDAAGLTGEFNRNVLRVINRALDADFRPGWFRHVAQYLPEQELVSMHLEATRSHRVRLRALGTSAVFSRGERLHTEISRKFTRASATGVLRGAGLSLLEWYESADGFALMVAARPQA